MTAATSFHPGRDILYQAYQTHGPHGEYRWSRALQLCRPKDPSQSDLTQLIDTVVGDLINHKVIQPQHANDLVGYLKAKTENPKHVTPQAKHEALFNLFEKILSGNFKSEQDKKNYNSSPEKAIIAELKQECRNEIERMQPLGERVDREAADALNANLQNTQHEAYNPAQLEAEIEKIRIKFKHQPYRIELLLAIATFFDKPSLDAAYALIENRDIPEADALLSEIPLDQYVAVKKLIGRIGTMLAILAPYYNERLRICKVMGKIPDHIQPFRLVYCNRLLALGDKPRLDAFASPLPHLFEPEPDQNAVDRGRDIIVRTQQNRQWGNIRALRMDSLLNAVSKLQVSPRLKQQIALQRFQIHLSGFIDRLANQTVFTAEEANFVKAFFAKKISKMRRSGGLEFALSSFLYTIERLENSQVKALNKQKNSLKQIDFKMVASALDTPLLNWNSIGTEAKDCEYYSAYSLAHDYVSPVSKPKRMRAVYQFITEAKEDSLERLAQNPQCGEALRTFCGVMGSAIQTLAPTIQAIHDIDKALGTISRERLPEITPELCEAYLTVARGSNARLPAPVETWSAALASRIEAARAAAEDYRK